MLKMLTLPTVRRSGLSRVWVQTGNPRQPLAQVWIAPENRLVSRDSETQQEPQPCCA